MATTQTWHATNKPQVRTTAVLIPPIRIRRTVMKIVCSLTFSHPISILCTASQFLEARIPICDSVFQAQEGSMSPNSPIPTDCSCISSLPRPPANSKHPHNHHFVSGCVITTRTPRQIIPQHPSDPTNAPFECHSQNAHRSHIVTCPRV